ncbi:MAG: TonB family protein, partial [Bacteroidia bacterium]
QHFYEDGKLRSEENYKNYQLHGAQTTYYLTGKKQTEIIYENGRKISAKSWTKTGKLIPEPTKPDPTFEVPAKDEIFELMPWERIVEAPIEEESLFVIVEQMPEFPGGQAAMFEFFKNNIQYPKAAIEAGVQGTVYVSMIIKSNCKIDDAKIIKSIPQLDAEALRLIKLMPDWIPGKQRGKPVDVKINLPVKFIIQ